jgi:hypothetical protein
VKVASQEEGRGYNRNKLAPDDTKEKKIPTIQLSFPPKPVETRNESMKKMAGGSAQFWFLEISINTMIHTSLPIEKMKTNKQRFCRRYYVPTARSLCSASQLRTSSDFMTPPRSLSNQNPDIVVNNSRTMAAATTTTTMFTNLQSTHDDPNRLPTSRGLENRSFLTGL